MLHVNPISFTTAAFGASALLAAAPAAADTPPPVTPVIIAADTITGRPILGATDSRGTNISTNGPGGETVVGMPNSRLGNATFTVAQGRIQRGVRTTGSGAPVLDSALPRAKQTATIGGGLENPDGLPPEAPRPGNEGTVAKPPPLLPPASFAP